MKQTIIAIIGLSGSGKTFAAEYLKQKHGIETVVSSTTRQMRAGETNGKEHWFVNKFPGGDLIAYTEFGGYQYWVLRDDLPVAPVFTYVIDEKGFKMLQEKHGDEFDLVSVSISRPKRELEQNIDPDRLKRDLDRETILGYDYTIMNDGTLKDLELKLDGIAEIFKNQ